MQSRSASSLVGRVLTLAAAIIAATGLFSCTTFRLSARDGVLADNSDAGPLPALRATLDEVMSGAPGTYIDRLLDDRDSTIERWPARAGDVVHIWVDSAADCLTGIQAVYPAAVRAAFHEWAATGIPLTFAYVPSPGQADIRVHWTDHLAKKTGSTTWRTDRNGWLLSGDITLATHISDGASLDARGMRAIALHEVGHALGLSHSNDPHDIMAPLVRVDDLSLTDRNTIRLLYSLPAGHVQ